MRHLFKNMFTAVRKQVKPFTLLKLKKKGNKIVLLTLDEDQELCLQKQTWVRSIMSRTDHEAGKTLRKVEASCHNLQQPHDLLQVLTPTRITGEGAGWVDLEPASRDREGADIICGIRACRETSVLLSSFEIQGIIDYCLGSMPNCSRQDSSLPCYTKKSMLFAPRFKDVTL